MELDRDVQRLAQVTVSYSEYVDAPRAGNGLQVLHPSWLSIWQMSVVFRLANARSAGGLQDRVPHGGRVDLEVGRHTNAASCAHLASRLTP